MPKQSYGQELIEHATGHINEEEQLMKNQEIQRMREVARRSNFNLGHIPAKSNQDKYAVSTSSNVAFNEALLKFAENASAFRKPDNKSANFKFGTQNTPYVTTNNDNYNEQLLKDGPGEAEGSQ